MTKTASGSRSALARGLLALGERSQAMIDALASISAEPDRLTRLYLTDEHKRAAHLVGDWMRRAGMAVRMDAAGTMHGLFVGTSDGGSDAPRVLAAGSKTRRLLIGSHIDTVIDAGRFDGNLGVVAGIIAVEEIRKRGISLPFDLEVLAFGDEEGVRFPKTLFGSSTVAGVLEPAMLDLVDADGVKIGDALLAFGGDPKAAPHEGYRREDIVGYLEVHIEQGPVLEAADEPLGVVSAIASQGRYRIEVKGEAGHAGTVPMALRKDALVAAAEIVSLVEAVARRGAADSLVGTVGEVRVSPGASNVIPSAAALSLDLRAPSDATRAAAAVEIRRGLAEIATRRGVAIRVEAVLEKPVALCAPWLKQAIGRAIAEVTGRAPRELMSGAGHDGHAMIHLTDIGMIFVRCKDGISHNPAESVSVEDQGLAIEALVATVASLAEREI
jgi:allantoate deiminase